MMMGLGSFSFSITTAAYQQLRRSREWRWAKQDVLAGKPRKQFIGDGDDSIDLQGTIYPHFHGGLRQMDAVAALAGTGEPQVLVDGNGFILGRWCIEKIDQTGSAFFDNGAPRKIDFQIELSFYPEALP